VELFTFLEGISPWWWVALGVGLGAVEMATMSFFLIWPAIAALFGALLLNIAPDVSGEVQVVVFAVLSVALTFLGRYFVTRFGDGGEENSVLNSRANLMIGRQARVLQGGDREGSVSIDGIHWRAVWVNGENISDGSLVNVVRAEGMTLFVE